MAAGVAHSVGADCRISMSVATGATAGFGEDFFSEAGAAVAAAAVAGFLTVAALVAADRRKQAAKAVAS